MLKHWEFLSFYEQVKFWLTSDQWWSLEHFYNLQISKSVVGMARTLMGFGANRSVVDNQVDIELTTRL